MSEPVDGLSRPKPLRDGRLPLPLWVALVIVLTGLFLALGRALG